MKQERFEKGKNERHFTSMAFCAELGERGGYFKYNGSVYASGKGSSEDFSCDCGRANGVGVICSKSEKPCGSYGHLIRLKKE